MAKTKKTADIIENVGFAAFDAAKLADPVRSFAEKGMKRSNDAYAKVKAGADEAQKIIELALETATTALNFLSLKSYAALRDNAEAGIAHFDALVDARSLSEIVELRQPICAGGSSRLSTRLRNCRLRPQALPKTSCRRRKSAFEQALEDLTTA